MQIWCFLPSIPIVTNINFSEQYQYVIKKKQRYESYLNQNE